MRFAERPVCGRFAERAGLKEKLEYLQRANGTDIQFPWN